MKAKIATAVVAVLLIGVLGLVNAQMNPDRRRENERNKQIEAQKAIEAAKAEKDPHAGHAHSETESCTTHAESGEERLPVAAALELAKASEETPAVAKKPEPKPDTQSSLAPVEAAPIKTLETIDSVEDNLLWLTFETTKGNVVVELHPDWPPIGVAHLQKLIELGVYNDCRLFRVAKGFVVQFGIPGDPALAKKVGVQKIKDDPVKVSNTPGTLVYATAGRNTRTSQLFFNTGNNGSQLDGRGFAPIGRIVSGMEVVLAFEGRYGDKPTPRQESIERQGNAFLDREFPGLDSIKKATLSKENPLPAPQK